MCVHENIWLLPYACFYISLLKNIIPYVSLQALRFKKANVTHPELKASFFLPILGVKKNPSSAMYTSLGVITKGTVIEVNVV